MSLIYCRFVGDFTSRVSLRVYYANHNGFRDAARPRAKEPVQPPGLQILEDCTCFRKDLLTKAFLGGVVNSAERKRD